ncbi:MAG: thiol oxidoreductase [Candidatus Poribacteria bacterium]|nr:thiol oxidoreductase [Candidatus Poribacteria bacterium]
MKKLTLLSIFVALIAFAFINGCDGRIKFPQLIIPPDDTVESPLGDFETPFDMLSHDLNATFARGEEAFTTVFTVEEGLGPIFNNTGCISCHPGNGRGTPDLALTRFSIGHDLIPDLGGPQFQNKAIPGAPYEVLPVDVNKSTRLPPPIFGLGLIENIPVETILSYADETDADGDGISGRPNWVTPPDYVPSTEIGSGPGQQFGRFSRKAQVSSLVQQVAEAFQQDIGITNGFIPEEHFHEGDTVPDPEIDKLTVMETIVFLRLLSPPPRGEITPKIKSGEALFNKIECASCHVPTMQTGPSPIDALNEVEVHLYSDLLLHDMGEELADNRPDGSATGREWRTPPLWGTRLVAEFLGGTPFFLHDGRATTLEGAIRAHGGEAQNAKEAFFNLSETDQQAVIAFIKSL